MTPLTAVLAIALAYLIGGLPWGLLLGRWLRGVDIRQHGSGKTGATNAARTLGWRVSAAVFALDVAKGAGAIMLARILTGDPTIEALAGLAAIAGHCWSPYIRFTGGRGVATGIGGALALAPWAILIVLPIGAIILKVTRYVSLASLVGSAGAGVIIAIGALLGYLPTAYAIYGLLGAALIISKHHDNIRRLLAGVERRLGDQATAPAQERSPAAGPTALSPAGESGNHDVNQ